MPQKTLGSLPCPSVYSVQIVWLPRGSTFSRAHGRGVATRSYAAAGHVVWVETGTNQIGWMLPPTFKGSECPCRFFGLRARYTTKSQGPVHHTPAGDGVGPQRAARPLAHRSIIGPVLLGQTRPTPPLQLGWRSGLCCQGAADHGRAGTNEPVSG